MTSDVLSRESKSPSNQHPNPGPNAHSMLTGSPGSITVVTHTSHLLPLKAPALIGGTLAQTPVGMGGSGLSAGTRGAPSHECAGTSAQRLVKKVADAVLVPETLLHPPQRVSFLLNLSTITGAKVTGVP